MSNLSEQKLAEYREAFSLFDRDGDNKIAAKEVGTVMRSLGLTPTEAEIRDMVRELEGEGIALVDFDKFCQLAGRKFKVSDTENEIIEALKVFDKENQGYIESSELRHVMTHIGEKLTEQEVDQMIKEADVDGNGRIKYENFVKMMLAK